jgi:hypothetical protein
VFTAWYELSPYIKQLPFVFKRLKRWDYLADQAITGRIILVSKVDLKEI